MVGISIADGEEGGHSKQRTGKKDKYQGMEACGVFAVREGHMVLEGDENGWGGGACQSPEWGQI